MKTIHQWFEEYGVSHQNNTNKLIHWVCVPAIFFSIYGLIFSIPLGFQTSGVSISWKPYFNYANLLLILVMFFYFRLSLKIGLGMLIYVLLCVFGTIYLKEVLTINYWVFSLIVFVIAWIGQFIGHHIEGKKPSFFKDLQFLLIGPAWVVSFVYRKLGIKF